VKLLNTSGYIFSIFLFVSAALSGQDTLRTYGPRFGFDLARFAYLLTDPAEIGAEFSVDMEVHKNIYPVFELGYNSISLTRESYTYSANGTYGRIGLDYNLLPVKDRSIHHMIFLGTRYGITFFKHQAENIIIPNSYWGDQIIEFYENNLTGHWLELTGGVKTEIAHNFFMGWNFRYKFLLSKGKDELMSAYLIPGYGKGSSNRSLGISYSILYKIPILKK